MSNRTNNQTKQNKEVYRWNFPTLYSSNAFLDFALQITREYNDKGYVDVSYAPFITIGTKKEDGRRNYNDKAVIKLEFHELSNIKRILEALNYGYENALVVMKTIYPDKKDKDGKIKKQVIESEHSACRSIVHTNSTFSICITKYGGFRISISPKVNRDINLSYSMNLSPEVRNVFLDYINKAIDLILSYMYT